ncbi:winged helix-turn-helix domain-containing protein [Pseudoalteromonas denitrificans]|nr:winged helix-turn-helix domain-containing protein [Pseudoalteromonas denitrificans]
MPNKSKIGNKIINWQSSLIIDDNINTKLEPLPLAFLKYLYDHPGQIMSRAQLIETVWHNRQVTDDAIRRVVKKVRSALGDDAKSPRYIKTYPMQGYALIAPISEVENITEKIISKSLFKKPQFVIVSVLILLTFSLMNWETAISETDFTPKIEKLTHLSGSEIVADFCEKNNTLLFTYRTNNDAPFSLYSKNLTTQITQRLSFNDDNFYGAFFSPDCSQVAFNISNESGVFNYISKYTEQGLIAPQIISKEKKEHQDEQLITSWSSDGKKLYFEFNPSPKVTGTSSVITRYNTEIKDWQQITFSHTKGMGDYLAKESLNGQYLAVLRNTAQRRVSLLILDLQAKEIVVERHVPFFPSGIVWLKNEDEDESFDLVLSSFKGDFYYYNILTDSLQQQVGSKPGVNDAFYHCGNKCFYMRQHEMNYSDIKEVPNPFIKKEYATGMHLESDNADFNPVYNHDGSTVYFTSKDDVAAKLMRITAMGDIETLYQFNPRHVLHSLQISQNELFITGIKEDRIFVFDIKLKSIKFITTQQEQVFSPLWDAQSQNIYFSRFERNTFILQKFNLVNGTTHKIEEGLFSRYETQGLDVYLLDAEHKLYKQQQDGTREFIITLGDRFSQHWQIVDNDLYFTVNNKLDTYIHRVNLKSGETQKKLLFKNTWNFEFMLHPNGQKMLITQSLLAKSDLVKVQWK